MSEVDQTPDRAVAQVSDTGNPEGPAVGIRTLLLTDVEGSTALWECDRDGTAEALALHDALATHVVREYGGEILKPRGEGDSLFCVFGLASDALCAAIMLQKAFREADWPSRAPLKVRMAVHTGEVDTREGDLYGPTVNRCARLRAAAHGGQILVSLATQQLASDQMPLDATWRDLGAHRLRDLSRPERLFQLLHPDLPADFPTPRTLEYRANNLPVLLTAFVGRERELRDIEALLSDNRLISLTGPGGTGKTRLALHAAGEALDRFPDGVCFVDLAAIRSEALVEGTVLTAIGSLFPGVPADLRSAVANRKMLIVLDNCEHLQRSAAVCTQLLLQSSPQSTVVCTSRHGLGIAGERLYPVPPMAAPKPGERALAKRLAASDAGRLFLDRARAVQPSFAYSAANAPAVAAICDALDGIPLALELAAARLRALSPAQIMERLQDRFALLTSATPSGEGRHRTLRATLDWSFELLSDLEKQLLLSLSIFRGGWTLEAAETVCAVEDLVSTQVLDSLQALVEKSMVVYEPSDSGPGRYRLLESVRQYGREKADASGLSSSVAERHGDWFHDLIRAAEPNLTGSAQAEWFERIERDLDNIRAAIGRLQESSEGRQRALQMTLELRTFWIVRGHFSEAKSWMQNALEADAGLDAGLRARAHNVLGIMAMLNGDLEGARPHLAQALDLRRQSNDLAGQAAVLSNLGIVERYLFHFEEAREFFAESVDIYRRLSAPNEFSYALLNLGCAYYETGAPEKAVPIYEECLALMSEAGDQSGLSQLRVNQADVAMEVGDLRRAAQFLLAAIEGAAECGYPQSLSDGFHTLARLALRMGFAQEAAVAFGTAQSVSQNLGSRPTPVEEKLMAELASTLGESLDAEILQLCREKGYGVPSGERPALAREILNQLTASLDS